MRYRFAPGWAVVVAAVLGLVAGCGGEKGTLRGKVTVGGKPVENGTVMVRGGSGEVAVGNISNGEYSVEGVSRGKLKIAVVPGSAPPPGGKEFNPKVLREKGNIGIERAKKEMTEAAASATPIPPQYQDLDTTPVTHDTSDGMTKNIEIP
jgi:hypothetical protein